MNRSESTELETTPSTKPRVLVLCTATRIGGVERIVIGLSRQLALSGWEANLVFPKKDWSYEVQAWSKEQGVEAELRDELLDFAEPRGWQDVISLARYLRKCAPDIVNIHYGGNHISFKDVLAAKLARRRCVVSVHHPQPWQPDRKRTRWGTFLAARLADAVVVNSAATADVLASAGVARSSIELVPCGVGGPEYELPSAAARARLGLPDGLIVGTLARLVSEKGIDHLIQASALLNQRAPFLAIAGEGPEREALEELAASKIPGRYAFLGRLDDTEPFYRAIDLFALPSAMEGFGLVLVEAALRGVPAIASRVGGVPDVVSDGVTGLLVPYGNVPALADAIDTLATDPVLRRAMADAAKRRALADFTEPAMGRGYANVFLRYVKGNLAIRPASSDDRSSGVEARDDRSAGGGRPIAS